jgi:hypothetical protein
LPLFSLFIWAFDGIIRRRKETVTSFIMHKLLNICLCFKICFVFLSTFVLFPNSRSDAPKTGIDIKTIAQKVEHLPWANLNRHYLFLTLFLLLIGRRRPHLNLFPLQSMNFVQEQDPTLGDVVEEYKGGTDGVFDIRVDRLKRYKQNHFCDRKLFCPGMG